MVSTALLEKMKANKAKYSRSAGRAFKFPEGRTKVRILPNKDYAKDDTLPWHQQVAVHWIKDDKDGKPLAVVGDVEFTFEDGQISEITPLISKAVAEAKASGDEESYQLYKSWYAKKSILVNAIIRDGSNASNDPKIVEMGMSLFSDIMGAVLLYAEEGIDALDLTSGIDFVVAREGKGLDTTYSLMTAPKSQPVPAGTLEKTFDLLEYVKKEHFAPGGDLKAIAAIQRCANMTPTTAIAAPRGTALLTSKAASLAEVVADEPVALPVAKVVAPKAAAPKAAAAKAAPVVEEAPSTAPEADSFGTELDASELDGMLADLDGLVV